ncbi:hypothetical protein [uncultured Dokdonia sp.]|uniref:hypothetical protein n=1 Tax=uncultured Dokdonia sp. TaxID=575653 RepID=UPI00260D91A6|nr:hypothetical protein [uncultured Dokdonia sp.]
MLKNILNLEGAQQLNKTEQKSIKGGVFTIGGVPIGSTCDYNSLQACLNVCTAPGTSCAACADTNATPGTYECRAGGFTIG